MASAALLEDLFFDALGMFVRESHPRVTLERRSGKELWDYGVDGLRLSHKEGVSIGLSVWWTAGDRDPTTKAYVPKPEYQTFTATFPVVMVYTGGAGVGWSSPDPRVTEPLLGESTTVRTGTLVGSLGSRAIRNKADKSSAFTLVLGQHTSPGQIQVERVWRPAEWASLTFHDLWPVLGGPGIGQRDLWLDQVYADGRSGLSPLADMAAGIQLTLDPEAVLPGIYVLSTSRLRDVPMIANNRAHSVDPSYLQQVMREAAADGDYLPIPTWFAHFATSQPPNLYAKQREQYEALFAARRREH
jgi:hypothetical protein